MWNISQWNNNKKCHIQVSNSTNDDDDDDGDDDDDDDDDDEFMKDDIRANTRCWTYHLSPSYVI